MCRPPEHPGRAGASTGPLPKAGPGTSPPTDYKDLVGLLGAGSFDGSSASSFPASRAVHQQPPADAMDEHPSRPIPQTARVEVQQAVLPDPETDGEPAAS
ncbi:hypothetical protein [Streptomyces nigrescens]|uniref:hypothetical protein n=1 Tax=Streptomyces nigrescens TaxID=1920 RepID=UPI0036CBA7D7